MDAPLLVVFEKQKKTYYVYVSIRIQRTYTIGVIYCEGR